MSGKQHMTLGITSAIVLIIALITINDTPLSFSMILLLIGALIGSYTPDIDVQTSKASQVFNKILVISLVILAIFYCFELSLSKSILDNINKILNFKKSGLILFSILIILGKLSPHRMFTHKWFGTSLFCLSVYMTHNEYFFIGFSLGYLLHIVADRISHNGKYLKFFEFKLPFMNSKNKININW